MQNSDNKTIVISLEKVKKKMSSNIARGYISRAGIINYCLTLLRVLLECGYYRGRVLYKEIL